MKLGVVFLSGGREGQRLELPLSDGILRLGRRPENEIAFDPTRDLDVSGFHAELRPAGSARVLLDLESRNGLFVGPHRVARVELTHGLEVRFGASGPLVRFELVGEVDARPPSPAERLPCPPREAAASAARPAPARTRPGGMRSLLVVLVLLSLAGATVSAVLFFRARQDAPPAEREAATTRTPAAPLASARAEVGPDRGVNLVAGAARVVLPRGALGTSGALHAELAADGALTLELRPPQPLRLPALVTLPLPSGADLAERYGPRAPVVVLESKGSPPLLLRPRNVGSDSLTVELPHFSRAWAARYADAAAWLKAHGQKLAELIEAHAPRDLRVEIARPESYSTSARIGQIELRLEAVTRSGKGIDDNNRPLFHGLKARVTRSDGKELGTVPLVGGQGRLTVSPGESQPAPGQPPVLTVVLTLLTADGHQIATRTVTVPAGDLWGSHDCLLAGRKQFVIWYLKEQGYADHPDRGYQGKAAAGPAPSRVLDACTALTAAYPTYRDREFRDPEHAPGETLVWMQPWEDSNAGCLRDWISLKTMNADSYDSFKISAAHELAHRFQHQYSYALFKNGSWFHDASAELLAWRVNGITDDVAALTQNGNIAWLAGGVMSEEQTDNYGQACFLAYLADRYRLEVGRLWVEASNLSSWGTIIEERLKQRGSSLSQAWAELAAAWLVDHTRWGSGWGEPGVATQLRETQRAHHFNFSPQKVRVRRDYPVPYLSAAGLALSWAGAAGESALLVGALTVPGGKGWLGLIPGDQVSGSPGQAIVSSASGQIAAGEVKLKLTLGRAAGALHPSAARVVYWYSDWSLTSGKVGSLGVDLWALPQPAGLKLATVAGSKKVLSFNPSPLEKEKKLFRFYVIFARDAQGKRSPLTTLNAGSTELALEGLPAGATDVCALVRDQAGNDSPEACLSLAEKLKVAFASKVIDSNARPQGQCRYQLTPCNGRPPYRVSWSIENGPKQQGGLSLDFPCITYFRAELTDADGRAGVVTLFGGGLPACP